MIDQTADYFAPRSEQGTLWGNATGHLPEPPTVLPAEKIVYTPGQVEGIKRIAQREPRNPYRTGTTAHALFDQFKAELDTGPKT